MNSHKADIIQAAIQGLIDGKMQEWEAKNLAFLLECVYNSGYNEAYREIEENPKDCGAY